MPPWVTRRAKARAPDIVSGAVPGTVISRSLITLGLGYKLVPAHEHEEVRKPQTTRPSLVLSRATMILKVEGLAQSALCAAVGKPTLLEPDDYGS